MQSLWAPTVFSDTPPHPAQLRFEESRVKMVLKKFHLTHRLHDLINDYDSRWGVKRVTFESFMRFFPTFPVMLDAQSFFDTTATNNWMKFSGLFDNFQDTFVFKRYQLLLSRYRRFSNPETAIMVEPVPSTLCRLPLAMVFPCDGIQGGLIMHNAPEPLSGHMKLRFDDYDEERRPFRVWVEKFEYWLEVLTRHGWTPDSAPVQRKVKRQHPCRRRGAVLRPWMAEVCGPVGPDTYLLAWLWRMFRKKANLQELFQRTLDKDGMWVTFSYKQLATGIGISEPQMKRAVKSLRERGFVETKKRSIRGGPPQTNIRLLRGAIQKARDTFGCDPG